MIEQTDDWKADKCEKKLTSAKKIFVECLGCKLVPVKHMETMEEHTPSKGDKFESKAWEELVMFIGTQGLNNTKCKSLC